MKTTDFSKLEKKINYTFKNKELLKTAFTHKTFAFEAKTPVEYNERFEFLGDSILGFLVSKELYKSNKYFSEGELTRRRAQLVNNSFLYEKAKKMNLGNFLYLWRIQIHQSLFFTININYSKTYLSFYRHDKFFSNFCRDNYSWLWYLHF